MTENHINRYWMVRPSGNKTLKSQFIDMNVIAIGWNMLGSLDQYKDRKDILEKLKIIYSSYNTKSIGKIVAVIERFLFEIKQGDFIISPMGNRLYAIGVVTSKYIYDPNLLSKDYPNIREINWINKKVSDYDISYQLRIKLESSSTIINLDERKDDIMSIIKPQRKPRNEILYEGLSGIHFENFKAFSNKVEIEISPINVIAGVNSGGKSSIIQNLLLIRQTLITPYRSAIENALVLSGDLIDFPEFQELVFAKPRSTKGGIQIGFTIRSFNTIRNEYIKIFNDHISDQLIDNEFNTDINIYLNYDRGKNIVIASKIEVFISHVKNKLNLIHFIFEPYNQRWRISLKTKFDSYSWITPYLQVNRFLPVWRINVFELTPKNKIFERLTTILFKIFITDAVKIIRNTFERRFFYIGPLRSRPERVYLRRSLTELDVGSSGEYAIQQLHDHKDDKIPFVEVSSNIKDFHPYEANINNQMLVKDAVSMALRLLGIEQTLRTQRTGDIYTAELSIHNRPKAFVSITDVGFGISQILPIIALCLLSPPGSLLVFEQPEIHLHPRAQAGLADLILCLARIGKRFVIETHSDYIVNRFRRRSAEDVENTIDGLVNILFVRPPSADNDSAQVEKANINRHGEIDNWPDGFLTDSAFEARETIMASSDKRLKEQGIIPPTINTNNTFKPRRIPE